MTEPLAIVMNTGAGGSANAGDLEAVLRQVGLHPRVVRTTGGGVARAAERAALDGHALVAAGGDGTVSTVAAVALRLQRPLGVLPCGTVNNFARDIGLPLDLESAARVLAAGRTRELDVGSMNGHPFLNNASLGFYPRVVWERELARREGRRRLPALARAVLRTWRRYHTLGLRLRVDGTELVRRTPFLLVGNGEYQAEGLGLGRRSALNTGKLSVYLAPEVGRAEVLMLPLRALARRLASAINFEALSATELIVEIRGRTVAVALDGELRFARPPLRCSIRPGALRLIAPSA